MPIAFPVSARHLALVYVTALMGLPSLHAAVQTDLVVYGGTPAGIIAAVAAAREGASVVLIEPTRWIGGMVAGGLSKSDVGKQETDRRLHARVLHARSRTLQRHVHVVCRTTREHGDLRVDAAGSEGHGGEITAAEVCRT